jgi:hypothetical protein
LRCDGGDRRSHIVAPGCFDQTHPVAAIHGERRMAERKAGSHPFTSVFVCPLTFEEAPIS